MSKLTRSLTFLAIALPICWGAPVMAWMNGAQSVLEARHAVGIAGFGSAIAALLCAILFAKGERLAALGLKIKPNHWWFTAIVLAVVYWIYADIWFAVFAHDQTWTPGNVLSNFSSLFQITEDSLPSGIGGELVVILVALAFFTIRAVLFEEMGMFGYLYWNLRSLGFWQFSLISGFIWAMFNWPLVLLLGAMFHESSIVALIFYQINVMAITPMYTLLRDRSGSILAPGLYRGFINTIGIIILGSMTKIETPNFAFICVPLSWLLLVEWYRRSRPFEHADEREPAERKKPDLAATLT